MSSIPRLLSAWSQGAPSPLAVAVRHRVEKGLPIYDLVGGNPQHHGYEFPQERLASILENAVADARFYHPDALGWPAAREAVARYHGRGVRPEQVLLTPGTSMAYFYAFRLLANPGDEILCPVPTYPLFDDLAKLAGLRVRRYHLDEEGRLDAQDLAFQVTPATRMIVLVSPHNPTGHVLTRAELQAVGEIAQHHHLAVVLDEVFREFTHGDMAEVPRATATEVPLLLTLNGISKMLSLPGLKGGWMVAEGQEERVEAFLAAAEYLSDTLLPVNEVTQAALPQLLEAHKKIAPAFRQRLTRNVRDWAVAWSAAGVKAHLPDAGPYLCVLLKHSLPEAELESRLVGLVEREGILVHPGHFYGFRQSRLVMTCYPPVMDVGTVLKAVEK